MGQDVYPVNMTRAVKRRITHPSWQRFEARGLVIFFGAISLLFHLKMKILGIFGDKMEEDIGRRLSRFPQIALREVWGVAES